MTFDFAFDFAFCLLFHRFIPQFIPQIKWHLTLPLTLPFAFYSTDLFHSLFHRLNDICLCLCLLPFDFDSAAFFLDNFSTRTFILPSVIREHFFFRLSDVSYLFVAGKNGQLMLWNSGGACSWFLRLETDNSVAISPSSIISSEQLPSRMISFD